MTNLDSARWEETSAQISHGDQVTHNSGETERPHASRKEIDKLNASNRALPVIQHKAKIVQLLQQNQVVIICGETGSGKSTQLPQFFLENNLIDCCKKLVVTQPRRIAAISLASRVADEIACDLGSAVGYAVRFDSRVSKDTKIKFVTDGIMLRELLSDAELSEYGAIMIDEAHERTLDTDVMLGLIRQIVRYRPSFKVVISSATLDSAKFSAYFDNAPIFNLEGRRFPVETFYVQEPLAHNYIESVVTAIEQLHLGEPLNLSSNILTFLPGQADIERVAKHLNKRSEELGASAPELKIVPVYSSMPAEHQSQIFAKVPPNCRKVILATNIAETSLTIPDISYVVDTGLFKQEVYNPHSGMKTLEVLQCSKASANQRAGRAGRTGPGKCYRLYTKHEFTQFADQTQPEILRTNLSQICLLLLSLGVSDPLHFDWIDSPSKISVVEALQSLYSLGAVNKDANLTKLGRVLAEFPCDPRIARVLLSSVDLNCLADVSIVSALLPEMSLIYTNPRSEDPDVQIIYTQFKHSKGDYHTLVNIYQKWAAANYSRLWCTKHYLEFRSLQRARNVCEQLQQLTTKICRRIREYSDSTLTEFPGLDNEVDTMEIALASGYFMNIGRLSLNGENYVNTNSGSPIYLHPSSTLWSVKPSPNFIMYNELVCTTKEYARGCMIVDPKSLEIASPILKLKSMDLL